MNTCLRKKFLVHVNYCYEVSGDACGVCVDYAISIILSLTDLFSLPHDNMLIYSLWMVMFHIVGSHQDQPTDLSGYPGACRH